MSTVDGERHDEDVITVLTDQHDEALTLLAQLHESFAPLHDASRAAAGFQQLVRLLAVHETAEEAVVYPVLKVQLQAADVADPCLAEENEAKRMLSKLERMAAAVFEFPAALAEFEQALIAHTQREEDQVFPLLRERVGDEQRREMAAAVRAAEAVAPTHPHHGTESVLGNVFLGPLLAGIDRVRDHRRGRG